MKEHSMLSALILVLITSVFFMSMHNLDNAWNFNNIAHEFNTNVCDELLVGETCLSPGDSYEFSVLTLFLVFMSIMFYALYAQYKTRQIGYNEGHREGYANGKADEQAFKRIIKCQK